MPVLGQQSVIYTGLTSPRCGQRVAGAAQWLNTYWRTASVICLDFYAFQAFPTNFDWEAAQAASASSAGCARVLRVTCNERRPQGTVSRLSAECSAVG